MHHILVKLSGQRFDHLCRVAQPGWLDKQPVRAREADQTVQPYLHRQPGKTAHTAARYFLYRHALVGQKGPVDTDFSKFIHQNRPALAFRFLLQQIEDCRGFTSAEKAKHQVRGDGCRVVCHGLSLWHRLNTVFKRTCYNITLLSRPGSNCFLNDLYSRSADSCPLAANRTRCFGKHWASREADRGDSEPNRG